MRVARILLNVLIPAVCLVAGEPAPLPATAESAIKRYEAAAEAARRQCVLELTRAQDAETRRGNLDGALAIRRTIERLSETTPAAGRAGESITKAQAAQLAGAPLTVEQWERAPGRVISVTAAAKTPAGVELATGDAYTVLVHPADQWGGGGSKGTQTCDYRGYSGNGQGWMSLQATVGGVPASLPAITGAGELVLFAFDERPADNTGSVRVKVVAVR